MSKKILIIDDDPGFREIVRIALLDEISELAIEEARDGHIGEKKVKRNNYDLILLDYKLPFFMSGLRFLERTEKQRLDTPLFMVTGEGNEEVAAKAFRLGATNYLVKDKKLLEKLTSLVKEILMGEDDHNDNLSANLNNANSGLELVKMVQKELDTLETNTALKGEQMLLEFDNIDEFNKFSRLVKFLHGVKVKETKILENKFVLLLSLISTRFQRIGSVVHST